MGRHDITCDLDSFAAGIEELVGDIPQAGSDAMDKAVTSSTRKGVKTVKAHAGKGGVHKWSDRYVGGFASHVNKSGPQAVGEIGNKREPGLVHLLEKGHVTPAGRRTRAFPHMAPAFDEIQDDFVSTAKRFVQEALG